MPAIQQFTIPPTSARAFTVAAGQTIRIVDVHGRQPGDLVAFALADLSVHFSQARSRVENGCVAITQGSGLWSNTFPPQVMFTLTRDTHGSHDLLYPPCCRHALEKRFNLPGRDGCLELLARALAPWHVEPHRIPDPLNLFFNVAVDPATGRMRVEPPSSAPGSLLELRAHIDGLVAISTCPAPVAHHEHSEYQITLLD